MASDLGIRSYFIALHTGPHVDRRERSLKLSERLTDTTSERVTRNKVLRLFQR